MSMRKQDDTQPRPRDRLQKQFEGESLTKQSFADECDINNVMRRFERDGTIEHVNNYRGGYGDYLNAPSSYQEAIHQTMEAQEMFATLPAKIRREFQDDPGTFLDAVSAAENGNQSELDRLRRLKLLPAAKAPKEVPSAEPKGEAPAPASPKDSA